MQLTSLLKIAFISVFFGDSVASSESRQIINCRKLPNGHYEIGESKCNRRHIQCVDKVTNYYYCPKKYVWDHSQKKCSPKHQVTACVLANLLRSAPEPESEVDPNAARNEWHAWRKGFNDDHLCINKTDGLHDLRGPCSKYYIKCDKGKGLLDMCTGNQVFGYTEQGCGEDEDIIDCRLLKWQAPPCEVLPFGGVYGMKKGDVYFVCKGPHVSLMYRCGEGLVFSQEKEQCVPLDKYP